MAPDLCPDFLSSSVSPVQLKHIHLFLLAFPFFLQAGSSWVSGWPQTPDSPVLLSRVPRGQMCGTTWNLNEQQHTCSMPRCSQDLRTWVSRAQPKLVPTMYPPQAHPSYLWGKNIILPYGIIAKARNYRQKFLLGCGYTCGSCCVHGFGGMVKEVPDSQRHLQNIRRMWSSNRTSSEIYFPHIFKMHWKRLLGCELSTQQSYTWVFS